MKIIRSDRLDIQTDCASQREALDSTLSLYRNLVRDLMTVINVHWPQLARHDGNEIIKQVERLIHPTNKRPSVKYRYFSRRYYKFPSYLRRVAIKDTAGQVRSFHTRYGQWLDGNRVKPNARPPRLTVHTHTFPSLYQGQCIRFNNSGTQAFIKVYYRDDWIWISFALRGEHRFLGKGEKLSPLLIRKNKRWGLSVPSKMSIALRDKQAQSGRVLAVDVGINTTAACAVVDTEGTVLQRALFRRNDKDREYRLMQRIRTQARKQTRHGNRLPPGFCAQDHRRLKQLARNEAHQISRRIVNMARAANCDVVVVENLKRWRPKGGEKRTPMKARFHRWYHRMLVDLVTSKAHEAGIRYATVYPHNTSAYAYDGSGRVKRDKKNHSVCTFPSGKRYNADLNAANNIAAKGILKLYTFPGNRKGGDRQQMSAGTPGSPVTLSCLWTYPVRRAG